MLNIDVVFEAFGRFNSHWANTGLSVDKTLLVSSLPQHFSTTISGKGGFAISFYVRLWNAMSATAEVPTDRSVRKLPCKQGLLVTQRTCIQSSLCRSVCFVCNRWQTITTRVKCFWQIFATAQIFPPCDTVVQFLGVIANEWRGS